MSLLGSDAVGRLALGQLPRIGLTNTVLIANSGAYAVSGQNVAFKAVQSCGTGTFASAGNPADLRTALTALLTSYSVPGLAAAFSRRLSAGAGGYSVGANAAAFAARMLSSAGSLSISGQVAVLEPSIGAAVGACVVTGFDAGYSRDFEDWFPRPFDTDNWLAVGSNGEVWIPNTPQSKTWSAHVAHRRPGRRPSNNPKIGQSNNAAHSLR